MFLTLTCDSYGKVTADGTPADPDRYDYQRAARDALHFAALFDRLIQNLRRFLGYDVQYFAAVEPQRRLAPHVHVAIRGTVSRAELRQVLAATYHQVWWPPTDQSARRRAPAGLARGIGPVPRPRDRRVPADLGRRARRHRPGRRAAARRPVRAQVRRPGRAGRITRLGPVHRLPHQVPDQARRRLPPGQHRRPARPRRAAGRGAAVRALLSRPARTGCATASSPRTRARACGRAGARAKPTAASTSATPGAASWSPANGPARPSPTTAPTAKPGSWTPSAFRQPTPPATPGNPSPPATPTTCPPPSGSCTSSPTASDGSRARRGQSTSQRPRHQPRSFGNREGGMTTRSKRRPR